MSINALKHYPIVQAASQISLRNKTTVYLVGGTLRDSMAGLFNGSDFDFVVENGFDDFVESFAKIFNGKVIPWDFNQTRVVVKEKSRYVSVDFSQMDAPDIFCDLSQRDFTINSIAVEMKSLVNDEHPNVIDPLNGRTDFINKKVRMCSEKAFDNDPLRILRGVRFARKFNFSFDYDTFEVMSGKAALLKKVARERIKRELFTIFHLRNVSQSIKELMDMDVIMYLLPELERFSLIDQGYPHRNNLLEHSLKTVEALNNILDNKDDILTRYDDNITNYFNTTIEEGVTRRSLLIFAGIFHDIGKTITGNKVGDRTVFHGHDTEGVRLNKSIAKRLGVGRHAQKIIEMITKNHMRILQLSQLDKITERAKIRFLMDTDGVSIDVVLLAVSDVRATGTGPAYTETADRVEKIADEMLNRIFAPTRDSETRSLLTGREVMNIMGIREGTEVGEILKLLSDRERNGLIRNEEDALKWLKGKRKLQ